MYGVDIPMIEFEIDNKKISAEPGQTVIEVADSVGVYIPRFCYHKKLSVAANCRMCLVEVEKSAKPLPACATPVTAGMKVFTRSAKAIAAQRAVMEFLLINHPLDCPICDQGGECELQDLAVGYGGDASHYNFGKRSVHDKDLGPLVSSCMTRCIQCTRCVRFGDEIAGLRELGAYNRGENLEIGTYVERAMQSELSGNVIDVCPVGALTSKPYQFTARAWEMIQHPAIAPHDCVGSNIYVHTRGEEYNSLRHVMRVVPRANETINEVWLSDRDRFSYEALHHPERITRPLAKIDGQWQEIEWQTALDIITENLKNIIQQHGAEQIGAIASPNSTLEEFYLLQKFMRGIGSNNIDHRIHQLDFSAQEQAPLYPSLGMPIEEVEKLDTILLVGSFVRQEQPLLSHRIRKAVQQGARVICINPLDYKFNFATDEKIIVGNELMPMMLAKLAKALGSEQKLFTSIATDKAVEVVAEKLKQSGKTAIFLGPQALNHPQAAKLLALAQHIAQQTQATLGYLTEGANSAGAWLAGAVPHRGPMNAKIANPGLTMEAQFATPRKAYLLLNVEPELDCAAAAAASSALKNAEFIVALATFASPNLQESAHIILPISPFTETSGTFVNVEGTWQRFEATGPCHGESRPAWKVLRVLGNLFELEGFEYKHAHEIEKELRPLLDACKKPDINLPLPQNINAIAGLMRHGEWPMYRVDSLVRHAEPLQQTIPADFAAIRINSLLAKKLNLAEADTVFAKQNYSEISLPVHIDERVPDNAVLIFAGLDATAGFGMAIGPIELKKR